MKCPQEWKRVDCPNCSGHGLVSNEFGEPTECRDCGGGGFFWISSNDRMAQYPGGPFLGSWPGKYEQLESTPDMG